MSNSIISETQIRLFLQDLPQYNSLLDGVRFSPEMIEQASIMTVSAYNELMPPSPIIYSVESFPYLITLLFGTCGYLLRSGGLQQASNSLSYSSDNVTINDDDKAQIFTELGKELWGEFKEMAQAQKTSANLASCYGNVSSEWAQRAFVV